MSINNKNNTRVMADNNKINEIESEIKKIEEEYNSVLKDLKFFCYDGDLSENGDWILLQEKKEQLQSILSNKKDLLYFLYNNDKEKFNLFKEIEYKVVGNNEIKKIYITDKWNSNPLEGKISTNSPLGIVLDNSEVGKTYEINTKNLSYKIIIISKK